MPRRPAKSREVDARAGLVKCLTGISGFDEITSGGLPRGRTTLLCGGPGCGKTLFGMEFLIRGATQFDEPGVCLSFEESAEDLANNVRSLGFDVNALMARKRLAIDHIVLDRSLIEEAGEYDLEALFIRVGQATACTGVSANSALIRKARFVSPTVDARTRSGERLGNSAADAPGGTWVDAAAGGARFPSVRPFG